MYSYVCRTKAKMFIIKLLHTHILAARAHSIVERFFWRMIKSCQCVCTFSSFYQLEWCMQQARCIPRCDFKISSKLFYIFFFCKVFFFASPLLLLPLFVSSPLSHNHKWTLTLISSGKKPSRIVSFILLFMKTMHEICSNSLTCHRL